MMNDKEVLECMKRKLSYNLECRRESESEARQAQARADILARICEGMELDIARLEARISVSA